MAITPPRVMDGRPGWEAALDNGTTVSQRSAEHTERQHASYSPVQIITPHLLHSAATYQTPEWWADVNCKKSLLFRYAKRLRDIKSIVYNAEILCSFSLNFAAPNARCYNFCVKLFTYSFKNRLNLNDNYSLLFCSLSVTLFKGSLCLRLCHQVDRNTETTSVSLYIRRKICNCARVHLCPGAAELHHHKVKNKAKLWGVFAPQEEHKKPIPMKFGK